LLERIKGWAHVQARSV